MTPFAVQGWCPGALRPMMSGDGLVVRIRPRMAELSPVQAQGLARAALTHGNGVIDLTARANVQLRGIRPAAHLALLDDLAALDLLDPSEAEERHRNLTLSPFWQGPVWHDMARVVTRILTAPAHAALPAKFGVALDIALPMVLQATSADIRVEHHVAGWLVRPDGFQTGAQAATLTQVEAAIARLIQWFLARMTTGRGRMAALAGQNLPPGFDTPMTPAPFAPKPGPVPLGHLVGTEFGQMRAETLMEIAKCPIRITPWRMILILGPVPAIDSLITAPSDPRLRVTACTGAPDCPQGLQPTRDLARALAGQVPPGQHLHVSGCAKGCAHPGVAPLTLTATPGGFTLIRNGRAADPGVPFDHKDRLF